ncbi:proteasome regulatory non-ATPase subunit 3, putative [Bodo saltans]|uniref:26S proteasome regulatory subunit RPN3 n=1 Tax=Bodo saltans TaxID=75058 RepID=A0A0S4JNS0_BODSA|nr:proteasome regulatory non-ATPase subunit 3, putative [Bodo saltans]|eukprot:CUG91911.1 proteasome regulatory non-ATPase subunit 3, putative [Bodo saltans]
MRLFPPPFSFLSQYFFLVRSMTTTTPSKPAPLQLQGPTGGEQQDRLLDLFRSLTVRHDELGQEIVLNEILALMVNSAQFESAERIIANCVVHQPYRSTNQAARFFYFVGLVRAMRLNYVEANSCLQQALRKAPERAIGFRIAATKLSLVVQLLLGEIPPRSEFLQPHMKEALNPYLQLTSCVRFGNLGRFMSIVQQYRDTFEHDRAYSLIVRVRQHVIKTGLRRICQSYSRISLQDVCVKLVLENPEDAEYIVAKAIRDGVIDAHIDHKSGHVISSEMLDVYGTIEPLQALQRRTDFLNQTHNEAKRAMRYAQSVDPDVEEKRKKAEAEDREELARALEDGADGDVDFSEGI